MNPIRSWSASRLSLLIISLVLLFMVYVFQRFNYAGLLSTTGMGFFTSPNGIFITNRTIRLIINDALCMLLMLALFDNRLYLRIAFRVFLFECFVLLPLYLYFKITWEGPSEISSPLLSPVHRMIVNPLLMFILIGAFYYQQYITGKK